MYLVSILALLLSACGAGSSGDEGRAPSPTRQVAEVVSTAAPTEASGQSDQPTAVPTDVPTERPAPTTPPEPTVAPTATTEPTRAPEPTAMPKATQAPKATATREPEATEEPVAPAGAALAGVVTDSETGEPVPQAWVWLGDEMTRADKAGKYAFAGPGGNESLTVMAPGYAKFEEKASSLEGGRAELEPFAAKGVFLPIFLASSESTVERIFDMIEQTTLNSIVVDVKSDDGFVWKSNVPLAREIGAADRSLDLKAFTEKAHKRGIYVIGRFVVFKDNTYPKARKHHAITSTEGGLWLDYRGLAYTDPFEEEAWDYLGDLAQDIAAQGVDEIQYDYVRFPVDGDLSTDVYKEDSNPESRVRQITKFMRYMEGRLRQSKVFISADLFGLTAWTREEQGTGQRIQDVGRYLDYISLMLYPSGFSEGFDGFQYPTEHPYEIIKDSVEQADKRLKGLPVRQRPFLQAFKDYAWGKPFGVPQHLAQRRAAEELGTSGWLYWNPAAKYVPESFVENP